MEKKLIAILLLMSTLVTLTGCQSKAQMMEEKISMAVSAVMAESYDDLLLIEAEYQALEDKDKVKITNHADLTEAIALCQKLRIEQRIDIATQNVDANSYDTLMEIQNDCESLGASVISRISNYSQLLDAIDVSSQLKIIDDADALVKESKCQEALDLLLQIPEESEFYQEVCEKIYTYGVDFYNNQQYDLCEQFMGVLKNHKEATRYGRIAQILMKVAKHESLNYLSITASMLDMSSKGFLPANDVLQLKEFADFIPLIEHKGLYRSDETLVKGYGSKGIVLLQNTLYCYIDLGSTVYSNCFANGAEEVSGITIDSKAVQKFARKDKFTCDCSYIGDGVYHCEVKVVDYITKKKGTASFNIHFEDEKLVVSALTATGEGEQRFVEGAYSVMK